MDLITESSKQGCHLNSGAALLLLVIDTGIGIKPDEIADLFCTAGLRKI